MEEFESDFHNIRYSNVFCVQILGNRAPTVIVDSYLCMRACVYRSGFLVSEAPPLSLLSSLDVTSEVDAVLNQ